MMMSRNSAAVRICLLVEIVSLWRPPLKMPTGPSGLALMMASADVVGRDPRIRERDRIERDPDRGLVGAGDVDFADPRHLRDALGDHGVGDVIHRARRQRLRGQRQHEHGRRRRIGFAEPRQRRQVARQIRQRGIDRGLHVARGAVDVAADRELQLDAGGAERTGRGDLVDRPRSGPTAAPAAPQRSTPSPRGRRPDARRKPGSSENRRWAPPTPAGRYRRRRRSERARSPAAWCRPAFG